MKRKKLLLLALLSVTFSASKVNAQLALDLAGPGNFVQTDYFLNNASYTIEYDMYMHSLQNFNGGLTYTCGSNPGPLDFYVDGAGIISSTAGNCSLISSLNPLAPLTVGTWYNVAFVYTGGSAGIEMYIDGVLVGTHAGFSPALSVSAFRLGSRADDITNADAKFDNVRIWNTARTGSEVASDMTTCFTGNEAGLDILYVMEEGSGSTVYDLALGNGAQNGNITGTATWTEGNSPVVQGGMMNISACETYDSPSGDYTWTTSGTYTDIIPSTLGCDSIITINLLINSVVNNPTISDNMLCMGDTTMLAANPTVTSQFQIGDPNSTGLNLYDSYPCVYGNYYEGAKHQILVLASELTAMGMSPGEITGMEFYVDNINGLTDPLLGLSIKMGHTMVTDLDYTFETPIFTTTYSSASFPVSNGVMMHDFSTPFIWDGSSNVVIETCYNNDILNYTENPSMPYTLTSFMSVSYKRQDSNPGLCSETDANQITNYRPNFKLIGATPTILWTNATGGIMNPSMDMTAAVPTATGVYTLDVSNDISGCADNDALNVTVNANPVINLGADISQPNPPVVLDAGAGFTTYAWSTGAITQTISATSGGTYFVTVTNANDCSASDTIQVSFTAGIVNVDGSLAKINFYPNPTSDFLNMDLTGYTGEVLNIELIDMNGKLLKSFALNNIKDNYTTQFDLGGINDGVYLMNVKTSTNTYSHRILVNNK